MQDNTSIVLVLCSPILISLFRIYFLKLELKLLMVWWRYIKALVTFSDTIIAFWLTKQQLKYEHQKDPFVCSVQHHICAFIVYFVKIQEGNTLRMFNSGLKRQSNAWKSQKLINSSRNLNYKQSYFLYWHSNQQNIEQWLFSSHLLL